MTGCLIACRSLTYAQRSSRSLERAGYTATVVRMPVKVSDSGCGHAVKIHENKLHDAVEYLRSKGFHPKKAHILYEDGTHTDLTL